MSTTSEFINYLYDCESRISEKDLDKAKDCLLDYLGVTYAGARENGVMLSSFDSEAGNCQVIGTDKKTDALPAAFLNGYSAHTVELDDGHRFGAIHLGAVIISAALAAAQDKGSHGTDISLRDVLRGIILGYEAAVRCGISMQPGHKKRGYHTTGTCGTIGAAVSVAFMLKYDRKQMACTIAGAATSAAGFLEIQEDASEMKPYNIGHAAMSGLMAATLGANSLCPPEDILAGPRGVLRVMTDNFHEEKLLSKEDYLEIERIYVKPYAACRHCHPAIEAALAIKDKYGVLPENIDHIEVHTYELAVRGHDHTEILGTQSAKLSMPFSVAAAYITNGCGLEAFSEDSLNDENILNLTKKVSVQSKEEFTKLTPMKRASEVHLFTDSGEYVERVDYAKGDPENPMSSEEIKSKFKELMEWSGNRAKGENILSVLEKDETGIENLFKQI